MAVITRPPELARILLFTGALAHFAGLVVYDAFPFLYLLSILILCWSYYLFLKTDHCRPFSTLAFWGMAAVLAIPVVGLIAGVQKVLMAQNQGSDQKKQSKLLISLTTLLLLVPIVVVFAAIVIPVFPNTPLFLMRNIIYSAIFSEIFLVVIVVTMKKKK